MTIQALSLYDGDVVRSNGRAEYISGTACEQQLLEDGLALVLQEWFLEPDKGVDWFGIFELPYSEKLFESEVRNYLLDHPQVTEIVRIEIETFDRRNRQASAIFEVKTIEGNLEGAVIL